MESRVNEKWWRCGRNAVAKMKVVGELSHASEEGSSGVQLGGSNEECVTTHKRGAASGTRGWTGTAAAIQYRDLSLAVNTRRRRGGVPHEKQRGSRVRTIQGPPERRAPPRATCVCPKCVCRNQGLAPPDSFGPGPHTMHAPVSGYREGFLSNR